MNKYLKSFILSAALFLIPSLANAALPWGLVSEVAGATPTCTTFSTNAVCIENMTANVTSLTVSGGTAGNFYTLILTQDGTGSRTFAVPTNITAASFFNGGVLPAIPTAANAYTVWVLQAVGATPVYQVVNAFDNAPLFANFVLSETITTVTAAATATTAAAPTVVFPGLTTANSCSCIPVGSTVGGVVMGCQATTNLATCNFQNPGAATPSEASVVAVVRAVQ